MENKDTKLPLENFIPTRLRIARLKRADRGYSEAKIESTSFIAISSEKEYVTFLYTIQTNENGKRNKASVCAYHQKGNVTKCLMHNKINIGNILY